MRIFGKNGKQIPVLKRESIIIGMETVEKEKAIEMAGQILVDGGYVTPEYIKEMKKREEEISTYIGNGVAIPHGTGASRQYIKASGISVIQFPDGIDFGGGQTAYLVIGIAGKENEHLKILQNLALICQDPEEIEEMVKAKTKDEIYRKLAAVEE
ncbi:Mannitol-specific phosphotransferase enzyme IIA component [Koleobacter methoxysyntrophicus]|uniref:Mannitol-specific phosphotransferase enzyme IIA component n=1 Tax=Koleobacter methoxysyntrophicus TaxID=2751313 RepID=A0A8A0RLU6_9FIRM|nr:PTS sugar transporter subunit IIA [Koleobacter methoxysyntrophicus]QSQ08872.1 Mannitol-specific phosphotransferase enzyme IIA component [Koleobacter methoxysyntrophicus]